MRKCSEAKFSHCRAAASGPASLSLVEAGEPRLWREELIQDEVLL